MLAFTAGVLTAYVLAAVAATQAVMARLAEMGIDVTPGDRLRTTLQDLVGMAELFLPIIAVAFLIAFPVAALISRYVPKLRAIGYPLAGGVALLAIHLILHATFGTTPVAAARTAGGLGWQVMAGALGGLVFLRVLPRPSA
ncbi:MAG: hypothetical protein R3E86_09140 [Pseudomonadales bacterium]